ncbi:hypothetical protein C2E21_0582 [Chlorella sorokiniana]|uniref:Glycosyltransferase 61 catalytic domain-containing protein n=1 Tax=Chlorella sorokiniana TaxID=3076 RepID=A0A2P6U4G7_CHLSO|nr:hypothetical protein C2E21_0582 [Chlorella sorokiniana]|eukprot:PRW61210.1 hypothetical protein C2E21_0582 [Chlorella sorokiniana]
MILHSGEKTPNNSKFTHDPLFKAASYPSYVLPGYEEPLGTPHYIPPCWDIPMRGPTPLDPADVWQPKEFTNCTVPLVWFLSYFNVFGELFLNAGAALDAMKAAGALDRNVTLAPVTLGLDVPAWYQPLLEPYTRHKVTSLSALSSREHLLSGQPRCFERAVLCNLVGIYASGGTASSHWWSELRPKTAGRRAVEYYREAYPDKFRPHEQQAEQEAGQVFRVAFMARSKLRAIVNVQDVVEECKKWVPPADTPFKRTDCVLLPDGTPENFADILAQLQNVHAFVGSHGSQNSYQFFMKPGTALVEILPWNFHGEHCTFADQYYKDWYELDHSVDTAYFRLVADKKHTFMGPYEKAGRGSSVVYGRDQDVALDFPTLAKALTKVARGELECTPQNFEGQRLFYMVDKDICPATAEFLKKQEEEQQKAAATAQQVQQADQPQQQEAAAAEQQQADQAQQQGEQPPQQQQQQEAAAQQEEQPRQ